MTPNAQKVLFVCVHNSARSQMAEAFLNQHGKGLVEAESAGLEPGPINPLVVEAMQEIGLDLSRKAARSVFDLYKAGRLFDHVITVCDESIEAKCPIFPGIVKREHWGFSDPAAVTGIPAERLAKVRAIRDDIEAKVKQWLEANRPALAAR